MKLVYRASSMLISVLGGLLAGVVFKQAWKLATGDDDAPDARDPDRGWREVLIAAALQGAVFGLVKAATHRAASRRARGSARRPPGR